MDKRHLTITMLAAASLAINATAQLNMPLVQTKYTADPAPVVVNDTIYLYTTHD